MISVRYSTRPAATLLYDGECGLCRATAAWFGGRLGPSTLRLMDLIDAGSDPMVAAKVDGRDLEGMLHLVDGGGRVLTGATAVVAAGKLLPRWQVLARMFDHRIGYLMLEPVYRLISGHRRQVSRLLRIPPTCAVPRPAERPGTTDRGDRAIAG